MTDVDSAHPLPDEKFGEWIARQAQHPDAAVSGFASWVRDIGGWGKGGGDTEWSYDPPATIADAHLYLDDVDASNDVREKLDASWRAFDWVEWSTYTDDADDEDEEFEADNDLATEARDGRTRFDDA
jgi:hypothetical protein